MFTKRSLPVTGTTLGIERIIDVIEELEMYPPSLGRTAAQVLVTVFDGSTRSESVRLSSELRQAGFNVETSFSAGKLGKQIRYASEKGIPFLAVLGPDEIGERKVTLRNMGRREEKTVERAAVADTLERWQAQRAGD